MSSYSEYYEILGLKEGASFADVKKAYQKLVIKYHPDHGGDIEKMAEINFAYNFLKKNVDFNSIKNSNQDTYYNQNTYNQDNYDNLNDINDVNSALKVFGLNIGENFDWNLISDIYIYLTRSHHNNPILLKKYDKAYKILKEEYCTDNISVGLNNNFYCKKCGHNVRLDDIYCNNCGCKLK